jgi:purine-cytosine permease-like protein
MADDDDDVRAAPGPDELFAPSGPRRSNFTPAPTDADSLEAANNVFNDDAIAAALAAELARVASGPIPIQTPPAVPTASPVLSETVASEPVPVEAAPEVEVPLAAEAAQEAPVAEVAAGSAAQPEVAESVEPSEPVELSEPVSAAPPTPTAPLGPPDWATPLFGQPTPPPRDESAISLDDPFAPNAPSFAPSTGSFPPPTDVPAHVADSDVPTGGLPQTADPEALRELYRGAPAPTVPAADAPPPPGYEAPDPSSTDPTLARSDGRPGRRSLPDDDAPRTLPDDAQPSATLNAIEQLQAQLHLREQEAQEFASWESAMQAIGTPEALAEVARARAELSAADPVMPSVPSAPPASEAAALGDEPFVEPPVSELTAPPVAEPVESLAPPSDEPVGSFAPPLDEPIADLAPPADEPVGSFAPPFEAAFETLAPPSEEPASSLAPPDDEPVATLAPPVDEPVASFAPPVDETATTLAPPTDDPFSVYPAPVDSVLASGGPVAPPVFPPPSADDNPFDAFERMAEERLANEATSEEPTELTSPMPMGAVPPTDAQTIGSVPPPPSDGDSPFAAFSPPSPLEAPDTFAAPSDLGSFDPPTALPDSPVFLEPPALVEPPAPMDGVEALYRDAGETPAPVEVPPAASVPSAPAPAPVPPLPAAADSASAAPPPDQSGVPQGFDDLLSGSGEPNPPAPSAAWMAGDPPAAPDPANDDSAGRRPFGEGVERDDAVDPSDSIFGNTPGPVSVNTAGVAVVPEYVTVESRPIKVQLPPAPGAPALPVVLVPPRISPAEVVGLEPTPLDQRVGRSARLFWLWFAANSSIVAIVFGTIIFALGVSLRQAIVATLAGVALSFIPLGLGTLAGKRSGQPTMVISRATFGVVGNIVPALIALVSRLFWAAALLWILGAGTADILIGARLADGFTATQITLIAMAIFFVIAAVIAFFGYALIAVAQRVISIISAITIVGFVALTAKYLNLGTALTTGDGPWILVVTGAVLVFSFVGLAWANSGADVARYQRPGSSGAASMLWATFGAALPTFILIGYGALLAASNLTLAENIAANPLDSLARLLPVWYPAPLLAATVLSLLSAVVLAMYSGGFALQAAGLRLRRSLSTLLVAVLVVVIAALLALSGTNLTQLIRDFSTTVAVPIAAWVGIFGAEVMIRKRPLDSVSLLKRGGIYPDVRWVNLIALVGISAISYGFLSATASGLGWEGYGFTAFGIPLASTVAASDLGVLVALVLGLVVGAGAGTPAIRKQEKAELPSA